LSLPNIWFLFLPIHPICVCEISYSDPLFTQWYQFALSFFFLYWQYREIQLDALALLAQEADGTGTQASEDRLKDKETDHSTTNGEVISPGMLPFLS
jgi:hypothetical protein